MPPEDGLNPDSLLDELIAAVEEELAEVRASEAARRIPVFGGRCLAQTGAEGLYGFGLPYPVGLPDDVPLRIDLVAGGEPLAYTGQLVSATSFEVTVACGARLPDRFSNASLTLDPSFILEQLISRLSELQPEDCDLPLALFGFRDPCNDGEAQELDDAEANEFQLEALRAVLERDVVYVWGPPGTGKTTALALIAEALVRRGLRVLAVAPTNVAVDNAALKIAGRLGGEPPVVRYGTPQLAVLRQDAAPVLVVPAKRLPDGADEAARQRVLRQARLVVATLSRVALAPELASPGFDAVVLDEASAAQLPAAFLAASLARCKLVALGDPKQLPPVAQSKGPLSRRWLQRDVFAQAGLEDDDPRAVLLREQYRMPPAISCLANELVYGGRLIDAPALKRSAGRARLVDTSGEAVRCERQGGSRLNRIHAELAVQLAEELAGSMQGSVAVITPYRAQARLIWRMLRDVGLERRIDVGTVHRFQGLERQAIVFDTVEAAPERPAPFISGGYGSEAMRLINVALTRAQAELIVLADVAHLRRGLQRG
ncbi:MAG TPA: AAA domain-containing protein, partial [Chloroflexota bacterium]